MKLLDNTLLSEVKHLLNNVAVFIDKDNIDVIEHSICLEYELSIVALFYCCKFHVYPSTSLHVCC